jgi:hypothetical protein
MNRDDEEHLDLDASKPANSSTSHTLVISEEPKTALETSNPSRSPRVSKKKTKTGAAGKEVVATGSLPTPLHDDVSIFLSSFAFLFYSRNIISLTLFFCVPTFMQPLMKEMVDIGTRFIGFRDEADSLRSKYFVYVA